MDGLLFGEELTLRAYGATVESSVEASVGSRVRLEVLGSIAFTRNGVATTLPASRKVRALLAYLALAPGEVGRPKLCDMFWDLPNDPRGELRWSLSKLRTVVDDEHRRRLATHGDFIRLDTSDCSIDALELERAVAACDELPFATLRDCANRVRGEFLDGLELDDCPSFRAWLASGRRRFRALYASLLERLAATAEETDAFEWLERWVEASPFDLRAHARLFAAFARSGRVRDAEAHFTATARSFDAEGLDPMELEHVWRASRAQGGTPGRIEVTGAVVRDVPATDVARRASVAVLPFGDRFPVEGGPGSAAGALAHDVITRLAKLRTLLVIAQGTVFALHERGIDAHDAARLLNVDYVVHGSYRGSRNRHVLTVELVEARGARIVWTDEFVYEDEGAFAVLDTIGDRIVASVANEIEANERNRAILRPPESLDAWEAHHRGLWHMYRFAKDENEQARRFFELALDRDPTFSRAAAGLSFTYFQDAFQGWSERNAAIEHAYECAARSLMADDRDPAAHWAAGRALWLRDRLDESLAELERSIELSPNFAQGHYTLAFVKSQKGDPIEAIASADFSRVLSPFDPLLFGMYGARAMALTRLGRFAEAADFAVKAAARPNAHLHIYGIAAIALELAGRHAEALEHARHIRSALPGYTTDDFFRAFAFDASDATVFRKGARCLGFR